MKSCYLPMALASYTILTVFSNSIFLNEPDIDLYLFIAYSWSLVPILMIPLVLTAWQYSFKYVIIFTFFTNVIELMFTLLVVQEITFDTLPILGLPVIRAFAFGVVGHIINHLIAGQREQKRKLMLTNIQLAQHANTLEQLATSRERNRLARELHDTLANTLSGVAVNLEAVKTMNPPGEVTLEQMLNHSLSTVRTGLDETRRILQDLRARPLEDLGLRLALKSLVEKTAERASINCEVKISKLLPNLPPVVEQSIYRITQEALNNIVNHASANHFSVTLTSQNNQISLTILDNGIGFNDQKIAEQSQFGIQGMLERATESGGQLSIKSKPGQGTTIHYLWEAAHD